MWGNWVSWQSKKRSVVVRSSVEAEFRTMGQGICEVLWTYRILEELKKIVELPSKAVL